MQNQDFSKRCLGYVRGLPVTFVEFCTSVCKRCEIDKLDVPTKSNLEQLYLLLKRHCQNEVIRLMLEPIAVYWDEGVLLRFLKHDVKRYLLSLAVCLSYLYHVSLFVIIQIPSLPCAYHCRHPGSK